MISRLEELSQTLKGARMTLELDAPQFAEIEAGLDKMPVFTSGTYKEITGESVELNFTLNSTEFIIKRKG